MNYSTVLGNGRHEARSDVYAAGRGGDAASLRVPKQNGGKVEDNQMRRDGQRCYGATPHTLPRSSPGSYQFVLIFRPNFRTASWVRDPIPLPFSL